MVPCFIQQLGTGEVEMAAGIRDEEAVYITELYLAPNYSQVPSEPMLPWFMQLLCGPSLGFNTLTEAVYNLDTWEPHTEIMHY